MNGKAEPKQARRRPEILAVVAVAGVFLAVVTLLLVRPGASGGAAAQARALAVVQDEHLATWRPAGASPDLRREDKTVASVQGVPARGVVERDIVVEDNLKAAYLDMLATAEADGWQQRADAPAATVPTGTSWLVELTKAGACRCDAQVTVGPQLPTADHISTFRGITIRIVGAPSS